MSKKKARKWKLPVIDLSRTFDPSNEKHYGSTPIEPSNLSGQMIVDLIKFVCQKYDFNKDDNSRESMIFYGNNKDGFMVEINDDDNICNNYISWIKQRNKMLNLN